MPLRYFTVAVTIFLSLIAYAHCQTTSPKNTVVVQPLSQSNSVVEINPPLYGFYSKYLNCEGIGIRSSESVDNKALIVANAKIKRMLARMPQTLKSLSRNGAELHIIGKDQQTSDLPELRDSKNVTYQDNGKLINIDQRTRGMGGSIYASCGEENLLGFPNDRYAGGYDICMHEFAHTIMNIGFDSVLRRKIADQYHKAISKGLWKGVYASTNPEEYWAELTTWYFGYHGDYLKGKLPSAGPAGLHNYDIDGYNLLDSIYSGLLQPKVIEQKASFVVSEGVPSGVSTEKAKLSVFNNQSNELRLYWIDYEGKPKFYETVAPHTRIIQETFMSNVWMVKNYNDKVLVYLKVNDPLCDLQLN